MTTTMRLAAMWFATRWLTTKRFSAPLRSAAGEVVIGGLWRAVARLLARRRLLGAAFSHRDQRRAQAT
ncbi:MAG: hypothetical protein WBF49_03995, partial [Methyloceanibacter sp.]